MHKNLVHAQESGACTRIYMYVYIYVFPFLIAFTNPYIYLKVGHICKRSSSAPLACREGQPASQQKCKACLTQHALTRSHQYMYA